MPRLNDPALCRWAEARHFRLFTWQITEDEATLHHLLSPCYDYAAEAERRFHSSQRRKEWLAARVLLHSEALIAERILYAANGRPYLHEAGQYLSISHSHAFVFLQLSSQPVGIDAETRSPRAYRLCQSFLSADERVLLQSDDFQPEDMATALWCAKEAAFKRFSACGLTNIAQVHLSSNGDSGLLRATASIAPTTAAMSANVHFAIFPEYVLTVCE